MREEAPRIIERVREPIGNVGSLLRRREQLEHVWRRWQKHTVSPVCDVARVVPELIEGHFHPLDIECRASIVENAMQIDRRTLARVVRALAGDRIIETYHVRHAQYAPPGGQPGDRMPD